MQKIIKNSALLFVFALISFLILSCPKTALSCALTGLNTWFERMIPTLFPFMVLTGILIRMELAQDFARLFRPFLFPFFRLPDHCLYVIIIGFLCGFPMGAKATGDMYRLGQLTRKEASYLLAFCNNLGPVFFTGFVLSFLPKEIPVAGYLLGMYGIPFLYGIFLQFTGFRSPILADRPVLANSPVLVNSPVLTKAQVPGSCPTQKPPSFAATLDASVSSGIQSITKLGGYMIFFNLLNLLPQVLFAGQSIGHFVGHPAAFESLQIFCSLFLEITGGIATAGKHPVMLLSMLQFGGLSCLAQTYCMISDTDLSLYSYLFHKCIQTGIAFFYYQMLFAAL